MKLIPLKLQLAVATTALMSLQPLLTAETNAAPARIGIYDSRVLAYAYFTSDEHMRQLNAAIMAAKQAKTEGQTERSEQMAAALRKQQEEAHLQVFGSAPVDDALLALKEKLPALQEKAGVSNLVSKWDEAALSHYSKAELVDVTDLLAEEFKPTDAQRKVIASIKKSKPVSAEEIKKSEGGH